MVNKKLPLIILFLLVITVIFLSVFFQQKTQKKEITVPASSSSSQKEDVSIKNFDFNPATITIKVGTIITWTNEDSATHTITSEGNFDSGILNKEEAFSYVFNDVGIFDYICTIHPYMKGKIIVME